MTEFDTDDRPTSVNPGRASRRLSSRDDTDLQYQRISLELMHDPDILNMMRKSYSLEDVGQLPDHAEEDEVGGISELWGEYITWGGGGGERFCSATIIGNSYWVVEKYTDLPGCSGASVGSPLTKAFHWGRL